MRRFVVLISLMLAWQAAPATAQLLNPLESSLTAGDAALTGELHQVVSSAGGPLAALAKIDDILKRPSLSPKQKVIVASFRISTLYKLARGAEAKQVAVDLAIAQPGDPFSHMLVAEMAFYNSDFAATSDAISRATMLQPDLADWFDPYSLIIIFTQLESARDTGRKLALARRLFDAGWDRGDVDLRSGLAVDVMADLLNRGSATAGQNYIRYVEQPSDLAKLLSEHRYAPLRISIEDWAGPRLEKQWPIYLDRTRREYQRKSTPESAQGYARALQLAGHHDTLIQTFLPVFERKLDADEDELWVFLISMVAEGLAHRGRWEEAFALFDRAAQIWPAGRNANSINISSNRARLRLMRGDFDYASKLFDQVIAEAAPVESEVTPRTMALIMAYRTCARHQLGSANARTQAKELARDWSVRDPSSIAWMWLCLGDQDEARKAWLTGLADKDGPSELLAFTQPRSDTDYDSDFARLMHKELGELSDDPALVAAASKIGVRRRWKLRDYAPSEVRTSAAQP